MKKITNKLILLILFCLSVAMLGTFAFLLIKNNNLDKNIILSSGLNNAEPWLWVGICSSIVLLGFSSLFIFTKDKKSRVAFFIVVCLFASLNISIMAKNYFYIKEYLSLENKITNNSLKTITLEELNALLKPTNINDITYVYIGRDTCPDCNLIYPKLCEISKKRNLDMLYYNTDLDRNTRKTEMSNTLDKISVKEVPSIIEINNDKTVEIFNGDGFLLEYDNIKE